MAQPSSHQYTSSGAHRHNGGAILSTVCVILWPLSFLIPVIVNATTSSPRSSGTPLPMFVDFLLACGFGLLLVGDVAAGVFGLYRAIRFPRLRRSLW